MTINEGLCDPWYSPYHLYDDLGTESENLAKSEKEWLADMLSTEYGYKDNKSISSTNVCIYHMNLYF